MNTDADPLLRLIRPVPVLAADTPLGVAVGMLVESGVGGLPVLDRDGRPAGMLDEAAALAALMPGYLRDLHGTSLFALDSGALRRRFVSAAGTPVGDCVDRDAPYIGADDSITHAAAQFIQHRVPVMGVLDGAGNVVGVLSRHDLVGDLVRRFAPETP